MPKKKPKPPASPPASSKSKPASPSLAPKRLPDVDVPDPQERYDESIDQYEADARRELASEPLRERKPGTSSARQAEHPAPSAHRGTKLPRRKSSK